jgi:hypothetical protein
MRRYIEGDPVALAAGLNTYAYLGGNPISNKDPLGLVSFGVSPPFSAVYDEATLSSECVKGKGLSITISALGASARPWQGAKSPGQSR